MKINEVSTKDFGKLKNFTSPELNSNIVVVYGRNEAGKSTLFNLITSLLYGFSPASHDKNPYFPWDGGPMNCQGIITTASGQQQIIRSMASNINGTCTIGDKVLSINNKQLQETEGISRELFSELYAITQDKLSIPNSNVWQKLQDQLLGGQYTSFLKPTGKVLSDIQSQADELYRTSNRGKSKEKELSHRIKELTSNLKDAEDNEKKLHENERDLHQCQNRLSEAIEKKKQLMLQLDHIERLQPVVKKLEEIDVLDEKSSGAEAYDNLPQDILKEITDLEKSKQALEREKLQVCNEKDVCNEKIAAYTHIKAEVFNLKGSIESLSRAYSQTEGDISSLRGLEYKLSTLREAFDSKLRQLAKGSSGGQEAVESIDEVELRECTDRVKASLGALKSQETRLSAIRIKEGASKKPLYLGWIAGIVMALGVIGLLVGGSSPTAFAAALLLGGGAVFLLYFLFSRLSNKGQLELQNENEKYNSLKADYEESTLKLKACLKGVDAAETRIMSGDETLLMDVRTIKDNILTIASTESQIKTINERIEARASEALAILRKCGAEGSGHVLENIITLDNMLKDALQCQNMCTGAKDSIKNLDNRLEGIDTKLKECQSQLAELKAVLDSAEGETPADKNLFIMDKRHLYHKLIALKEQLESEYPDLCSIKEEIEEIKRKHLESTISHDFAVACRLEMDELEESINSLKEQTGSLKSDMKFLQEKRSLDDLKSEISSLQEERLETIKKRDRLILMKEIISAADRRFRDEHQPDVLIKAGAYLRCITDNRYTGLLSCEDGSGGIMVRTSSDKEPIAAELPLSRGTLEQIYLSLRLAVIDHLDQGRERLPLFLDEAFVNWDDVRSGKGAELLEDISKLRQVFIFTCHEDIAVLMEKNHYAQRLQLS